LVKPTHGYNIGLKHYIPVDLVDAKYLNMTRIVSTGAGVIARYACKHTCTHNGNTRAYRALLTSETH